jgi:hypothetical protein
MNLSRQPGIAHDTGQDGIDLRDATAVRHILTTINAGQCAAASMARG